MHKFFGHGGGFHMLILAVACWAIWTTRNLITFEQKILRSPMVCVYTMCGLLCYWVGLYGEDDGEKIKGGAEHLMRKAARLIEQLPASGGGGVLRITDGSML